MARLNRAKVKTKWRRQCLTRGLLALTTALVCEPTRESGSEDNAPEAALVFAMLAVWQRRTQHYVEDSKPSRGKPFNFLSPEMGDLDFKEFFRFHKRDFLRLASALEIPGTFKLPKGGSKSGLRCFAYMLWRLVYPTTLLHDELQWGEGRGTLCEMFQVAITFL
ncbi:hypothetical protein JKP88DRAFT_250263 [Tribonema minus]|uniref:Uncharacterized protein n=1 Tax=Tribonema minus TaxID=303371 RepID=A0A836C857_9STRA|nr:hypothetical protein JKP88DRAFT_250263 [Tribonema minus]